MYNDYFHITVKATKSQGSSRSSRKSLSAAAADSYLDDSATGGNGQQGTFYVPGPRKGSFVPASTQNVVHFAPAKEDRRLYFATAEDILRFRADVEYVLPEDLTVEDLKSCVQEGKFHASMCPLPLPSLDSASTGRSPATEFKGDILYYFLFSLFGLYSDGVHLPDKITPLSI